LTFLANMMDGLLFKETKTSVKGIHRKITFTSYPLFYKYY